MGGGGLPEGGAGGGGGWGSWFSWNAAGLCWGGGGGGGGGFLAGPSRAAAAGALLHPHPGDLIKFTQQSTVNIHHQHYASSLN